MVKGRMPTKREVEAAADDIARSIVEVMKCAGVDMQNLKEIKRFLRGLAAAARKSKTKRRRAARSKDPIGDPR